MKFLLDMGLSQSTALFLRTQGHDAVHLREQGLQRLKDEQIIEKARQEERIIHRKGTKNAKEEKFIILAFFASSRFPVDCRAFNWVVYELARERIILLPA